MSKTELRKQLKEVKSKFNNTGNLNEMKELAQQMQSIIEQILKPNKKKLIKTIETEQYKIELLTYVNGQDWDVWELIFTNIETGEANEELSDTVYMSQDAAIKEMNKYRPTQKKCKTTNKKKETKQPIEQINMTASYGKIVFGGSNVSIIFTNYNEENTVTFRYRKSWSNKKYIDKAFELYGISPSWDFTYGWEHLQQAN